MATLTTVADWLERSDQLDHLAGPVHKAVSSLARPGRMRDVVSGSWLGHPTHPFLVATPIGCWTSAHLLDLTGRSDAAQTLVGAGVLAVVPTAITGLSDWADTTGAEQRIGFVHLVLNTAAAGLYARSWWSRRRGRSGIAPAVAGGLLATLAGWLGGHLAYSLGVGVDTNAFDGGPVDWTPLSEEVSTGKDLASAQADGVALVVVGRAPMTKALADRCSHRGGPLSDGRLQDNCVVCPWHASRFDVDSGAVRRGPAVVAQPTYEVRHVGSSVEVRRSEPRTLRTNSTRPRPIATA
ncbi:MAG: Rieske 2Fe-2S domain-containing protein [Actinomycetota bacterium]|nr:Rieske 2Fe-2S domain-containing protein [Actinomycetota bacterium]